jgi:multidrug efflux system outer membrane protein
MIIHKSIHSLLSILLVATCILSGCGNEIASLDSRGHQKILDSDRITEGAGQTIHLTLDEALARGVEKNLDARVAAIEVLVQKKNITVDQLKALPGIEAKRGYVGRDNAGATSSRSVLSGLQSLEPSQSTESDRFVSELSVSWNLLDAVMALNEAQSTKDETKITIERYSKVIQNIERDVYAAYWRGLAYQENRQLIRALLIEGEAQSRKLMQAADQRLLSASQVSDKLLQLSDRQRSLRDFYNQLSSADTELKSLLSLSQTADLVLVRPSQQPKHYTVLLKSNVANLESQALKNRPEMREDILQTNIATRNIRQEVFRSFPGAELLLSYNDDSNAFLQDKTWLNFSANIVQNLLNVFTIPARIQLAEKQVELEEAKRKALSAAILAQVHLAHARLDNTHLQYQDSQMASRISARRAAAARAEKATGFTSGYDSLMTRMEGQIEKIRSQIAFANLQDSYAAMVNTLGYRLTDYSKGGKV